MPVIILYGIPKSLKDNEALQHLVLDEIPTVISGIAELELKKKQVSTFCPQDAMSIGLGEELIAFVEGLYVTPMRTHEVRQRLARELLLVLRNFARLRIPECMVVEVFVKTFNPEKDCVETGAC